MKPADRLKEFNSVWSVLSVMLLLCAPSLSTAAILSTEDSEFHYTVEVDGVQTEFTGPSDFMLTPSSLSIYMVSDDARCGMHIMNFRSRPEPGVYDVEIRDEYRTGLVCVFTTMETTERVVSESGTFTITTIDAKVMEGSFDMLMKGSVSGKEYRVSGQLVSEGVENPMRFLSSHCRKTAGFSQEKISTLLTG